VLTGVVVLLKILGVNSVFEGVSEVLVGPVGLEVSGLVLLPFEVTVGLVVGSLVLPS